MADQDSLFDNIEDTRLRGLHLSPEDMDFHQESVDCSQDQHLQDTVWEQHHNIPDIPLTAVAQQAEKDLASTRAISSAAFVLHGKTCNGVNSFINPFFPLAGENDRHDEAVDDDQETADEAANEETADHVFCEWNPFVPHLVAPSSHAPFVSTPAAHHNILESVYSEMGSHISRRLSLAYPPAGSYEIPAPAAIPQMMSNLQFVIEDPAGRENASRGHFPPSAAGPEQGRRHSVGSSHLYCCPWTGCNKVFNRFYNLRSHYRIHSGEKPFTCNFCDASFARNHDLKRHERIHLKTKPFACPTCNKTFSRNDAMNRHIRLNSCARPNA